MAEASRHCVQALLGLNLHMRMIGMGPVVKGMGDNVSLLIAVLLIFALDLPWWLYPVAVVVWAIERAISVYMRVVMISEITTKKVWRH